MKRFDFTKLDKALGASPEYKPGDRIVTVKPKNAGMFWRPEIGQIARIRKNAKGKNEHQIVWHSRGTGMTWHPASDFTKHTGADPWNL